MLLSSLFLSSGGGGQSNGETRDIGIVQGSGIGVGSIVVGSDGGGDGSGSDVVGENGSSSVADGLDGGSDRDRDLMHIRDGSGSRGTFNMDIGLRGDLSMDIGLSSDVFMDIGLGLDLLMDIRLSGDLLINIGLSSDLLMDIGLGLDFLMDIGLSSDLLINIGLSGDILMDVGLSNRVQLRVGYRGIVGTGIDSGKGSNSSGNGLVGDGYTTVGGVAEDRGGGGVSIVVGIGIWATEVGGGQHTSRSRGNKAKGCNEGLHV